MLQLRSRALRPAALALALGCAGCFEETGFEHFIPYVPTPQHIVERMLELAEVGPGDYLIDLGSGDGRIAISAAKLHGARALGVEIEPRLVRLADENAAKAGVADKVRFLRQDLFDTQISEATVIALYLPPSVNFKLRPRLLSELRPGARVVSHAFSMGGWLADTHESIRGIDVYLWIIPAHVAGVWRVDDGARHFDVKIDQLFQEVRGHAMIDGQTAPLRDTRLRGTSIEFSVDLDGNGATTFRGTVEGDRIEAAAGADRPWRAQRKK